MPRLVAASLALALTAGALATLPARATGVAPPSPLCDVRTAPPAVGLSVVSHTDLDARLRDYTLRSSALGVEGHTGKPVETHVDVLLPPGYDPADTAHRYPVLYLLHGHGGHYNDWAKHGVEGLVGNRRLIVVMPDGGYDGFYSDWYGTDLDGHNGPVPPGWETYHVAELLPWVDHAFNTFGNRSGRAIAGLSMGGLGSTGYPARHPDLFSAAAGFSGSDDSDLDYPLSPVAQGIAANLPDRKPPDSCIWGDPITEDVVWRAHDPTELAGNLTDVALSLWLGNGQPGDTTPGDPPWNPAAGLTEAGIYQQNQGFIAALHAAGEHPFVDSYGPGIHDWPYWERDLTAFLGRLPRTFWTGSGANRAPASFDYESAEPAFSVWGWRFSTARDVQEFTYLTGVGAGGFGVRGSGRLTVSPPARYPAGTRVTVTDGSTGAATEVPVRRDARTGRITFTVDLGPSHVTQQYAFGPSGEVATFPTADRVAILTPRPSR